VIDAGGTRIGRVVDLVVAIDTGEHHPVVTRLLVGRHRHSAFVDVQDVEGDDEGPLRLAPAARPAMARGADAPTVLRDDELLLCRDVLDTQVIDLDEYRVARVADVALDRRADGSLHVVGVDVGIGRLLARFGIHRDGALDRFIDWDELHLASPRGHDAQLAAPRAAVHRLDAAGLADLVERLDTQSGSEVLAAVAPSQAAAALEHGHHRTGERLLRALPAETAHRIVGHLPHLRRHHWESHLRRQRPLRGRRFHRTKGWRRTHHTS